MEEIFNKIESYLSVIGMNCLTKTQETNFHRGRRYFLLLLGCMFNLLVGLWCVAVENGPFSIKIIVMIFMFGFFVDFFHNIYFVSNQAKFRAIISWVQSLYEPRKHPFVQQQARVLFEKCLDTVKKITKIIAIFYGGAVIGFCISPLVTNFRYPAPMEIPFTDRDSMSAILSNYLSQTVTLGSVFLFYGLDFGLFVIFSMHIIYEARLVEAIVIKFGEKEGHSWISNALRTSQPKIWQNQMFIKVDFEKENENLCGAWQSADLIKEVLEIHNRILVQVDLLSELYFVASAMWETFLVVASIAVFVMMHVSVDMVMVIGPTFIMEAVQYFIISHISSLIKDANEKIADGIYASKWYWLSVQDKKDILKILLQAQKPKSFLIGLYCKSNLERFADLMKCIYNLGIVTNVLFGKTKC